MQKNTARKGKSGLVYAWLNCTKNLYRVVQNAREIARLLIFHHGLHVEMGWEELSNVSDELRNQFKFSSIQNTASKLLGFQ